MHRFESDPNPAHVTYIRDMPFEHAVETVQSDGVALDFDFNHAYWMSELEPVDDHAGAAHFDGRSLAIPDRPTLTVPEAGGPASQGNLTPYAMTGLAWRADPTKTTPAPRNAFDATLTGARQVRLALRRMRIDPSRRIEGTVSDDSPLTL